MKPKDEPFFVSREHPTSFGLVKEPKQVPVAWVSKRDLFQMTHAKVPNVVVCEKDRVHTEPLYTSPPQRQPLTDELLRVLKLALNEYDKDEQFGLWTDAARVVLKAAHGITGKKE